MTPSPDPAPAPAARPWQDALLASVVENLPCGLSVFDAQLRLVAHNHLWQQLLDLPEALLHRPDAGFEDFARYLALRGDYGREPTEDTVQALVAEARQPRLQLLHLSRPGVTLEVRRSPLPGGGFITTYVDISAQRAAEEEIRKAKEAAEEANRAKGEFLDNVSHEIRTPLNGVLGLTRLLLAEDLSPQQRRYAELADASATSLLRLIDDLLDLGRIESGRLELEARPFDLRGLLEQLAELYRIRAEAKGLRFLFDVDAAVPAAVVGDAGRLRQILDNLLSNALKFTEQGEFGLLVGRAAGGRGSDVLRFTVHDTGIGISAEAQARLFNRFTQADPSTGRRYGGTGLGLAIVRQLCEQMGGSVLLQSEPGRGASFRCELPLPPAPEAQRPAPPPLPAAPASGHATRVLVAEDNETNQVVLRGLLAQAGYRAVTVVEDGEQALAAAARAPFDLVLMDCRMPRLDGYEAARRLRAEGFTAPIIALTANAAAGERERCLAFGMNEYLAKPVDPARLVRVLAEWTGQAAAGAPPAGPPAAAATFDRARSLEQLGGDEELLAAALASFRVSAPRVLQAAGAALQAGDAADLRRHLHSLAGSAAMLGAAPLHALARALEAEAAEGRLASVRERLGELEALQARFEADSSRW